MSILNLGKNMENNLCSRDHLLSIIAAVEGCKAAISFSSYIRKIWGKIN